MTDSQPPQHVAIIMDGNGRWARQRRAPRVEGHRAGVRATREIIEAVGEQGIGVLTLFAFSSENWRRPKSEVSMLLDLFRRTLAAESRRLVEHDVCLRFIGDRSRFPADLAREMERAETLTADCAGLRLFIAVNYGGRWDIAQAARRLALAASRGELDPARIDEAAVAREMCLADVPEPDLFIRTGGERRISNYLLWQLAYTELWFTNCLWPDFDRAALAEAIDYYQGRERRFGRTSEQAAALQHA